MEKLFGAESVVRTKFIPPSPRSPLLREHLYGRLGEARLAIVQGGAGFGKSTLLACFLLERSSLWFSLSETERDPQVFLLHLSHLIHRTFPGAADRALGCLSLPGGAQLHGKEAIEALTDALIDAIPAGHTYWLALDDFHLLHGSDTPMLVDHLAQRLPPGIRLAIASRQRPELPNLSRLLLQGDAVLLGQDQLCFQGDEIRRLFQDCHHLLISVEGVAQIEAETEGWPMGIQLFIRRLKEAKGSATTPLKKRHNLRELFDYLAREVFDCLETDEQSFLLDTATLPSLDEELCNALLGRVDSGKRLRHFLDSGLFLIPEGESYRHHHLFHEFLLGLLAEQNLLSEGYRKTSRFLARRGQVEVAIEHLLVVGAWEEAAHQILELAPILINQARFAQFEGWLHRLPESLLDRAPALAICQGDACRLTSRFEEALKWYDRAEKGYGESREGKSRALAGKALIFLDTIQPLLAGRLLEEALAWTENPKRRAELLAMLGENKLNLGDAIGAEACFKQVREERPETIENQGRICLRTGRLEEGRRILRETLAHYPAQGGTRSHREASLVLSFIEVLMGEAQSAYELATKALLRAQEQKAVWTEAVAFMRLGHSALLLQKMSEARKAYEQASQLAEQIDIPRLRGELCLGLAQLAWQEQDFAAAERLGEEGWKTADASGDSWLSGLLALLLGSFYARRGDSKGKRWLGLAQRAFEAHDPFGQALVTMWSAQLAMGLQEDARPSLQRLILLTQEHGYDFLLSHPTLLGFDSVMALESFIEEGVKHGLDRRKDRREQAHALKVKTFGSFQVWRDGEEVQERAWGREKARQLFHLLIVHRGEMLPKARLIDLLWPDLDPDGADGIFRVALNALNKALEPERKSGKPARFILRQGSSYGLAPEIWLDVTEFERLLDAAAQTEDPSAHYQAALALYKGDFLSEYLNYEGWCERERERLQDRFVGASIKLSRMMAAREENANPWLTQLVERVPSVEEGYRLLMIGHYRQGDRDLALRAYERCVENLSRELDLSPSLETQGLYQRILEQADSRLL